jgi:hypothetical protein
VIRFAVELGKVLCQLEPNAAAERDAALRAADAPPPVEFPPYSDGVIHRGGDGAPVPPAGELSLQGRVAVDGQEGLWDDVAGRGWVLIAAEGDPLEQLGDAEREALSALDVTVASLGEGAPTEVADLDGRLTQWLRRYGAHAVLIRPDFYVFGAAASREDLPALVADLGAELSLKSQPLIKER